MKTFQTKTPDAKQLKKLSIKAVRTGEVPKIEQEGTECKLQENLLTVGKKYVENPHKKEQRLSNKGGQVKKAQE